MRVACTLRELRGDRTLRHLELETGISRGYLSRWERGIEFPADKFIPALEQAYGAPAEDWYAPHVWLELGADDVDQAVAA